MIGCGAADVEAARPFGEIVWLGNLMGEKRITRSCYGGARPRRDSPLLARAYRDANLKLDELVSCRLPLDEIDDGVAALKRDEVVRPVVTFDGREGPHEDL
jgi:S-(hydroxymethyl)glutathione dehydrogenase/alcohol dehydrogenase